MDEPVAPIAPTVVDVTPDTDKALALEYLQTVDIETVSRKKVLLALQEQHGREFDKKTVYEATNDFVKNHVEAVSKAAEEVMAAAEEVQDVQEEEEEEDENNEPDVEFPEAWKERFDEVVWVKTSTQWPW